MLFSLILPGHAHRSLTLVSNLVGQSLGVTALLKLLVLLNCAAARAAEGNAKVTASVALDVVLLANLAALKAVEAGWIRQHM